MRTFGTNLGQLRSVPQVCKHQRKEDVVMFFLQFLSCVVSIFAGIVNGLNGSVALAEKYKSYIEQHKGNTEKDPSVSFPASDGPNGDCISNR